MAAALVFGSSFCRLCVFIFLIVSRCFDVCSADDPPRIETAPQNQTVRNNGVASFVCAAVGNPKPQIEWRKNGKRVTTQRYTVQEMPNGSVLRIDPVKSGRDDATYECVAENGVGEPVRALATLNVLAEDQVPSGFPRFTVQPQIQGVEKGRNALLPCRAEGNPPPTVRWVKSYIPVDMSEPRYSLVQGSSLQIVEAEEDDQGSYECVADNSKGTAVSGPATLYVRVRRVPPYFSIPPELLYEVMPGSNLNITCVAVGSPMPYVKWKKGLMELTSEHDMPIGKNVLQLTDIRESVNYTCVAASKLGSIEAVAQVVVQALPRPPSRVQISDVTASSVRISWSYDVGSENIIYYVIQFKPRLTNQDYSELSGINTMFYTVRDLTPYTEYEFNVIAVNAIGRGVPSQSAVVTTGETEPGSAPRNVHATPLSTSTVVVQWDPPKEPNGQVTGYKVYYTTTPNLPAQSWLSQIVNNNQLTVISDLQLHTIYTIRVQVYTSRGPGPLSTPIQMETLPEETHTFFQEETHTLGIDVQEENLSLGNETGGIEIDQIELSAPPGVTDSPGTSNGRRNHLRSPSRPSPCETNSLTKDVLLSINDHFEQARKPEERADIFGKMIALKVQDLRSDQRRWAEKLINDVLFLAEAANLDSSYLLVRHMPDPYHSFSPRHFVSQRPHAANTTGTSESSSVDSDGYQLRSIHPTTQPQYPFPLSQRNMHQDHPPKK